MSLRSLDRGLAVAGLCTVLLTCSPALARQAAGRDAPPAAQSVDTQYRALGGGRLRLGSARAPEAPRPAVAPAPAATAAAAAPVPLTRRASLPRDWVPQAERPAAPAQPALTARRPMPLHPHGWSAAPQPKPAAPKPVAAVEGRPSWRLAALTAKPQPATPANETQPAAPAPFSRAALPAEEPAPAPLPPDTQVAAASFPAPLLPGVKPAVPQGVDCSDPALLGTTRVLEVAYAGGTGYGHVQGFDRLALNPGEFVLTFDDGPNPRHTPEVLAALDSQCVKATFFIVGQMAKAHPATLADVYARGHSVGTHTHSHPLLSKLAPASAAQQIEDGFEQTNAVLRRQPHNAIPGYAGGAAPFFRFPGLDQSKALLKETAARDLAVFSCDVCTNDWKSLTDEALLAEVLAMMEKEGSGIVLMHDIQAKTARILPQLLAEMKLRGWSTVHVVPEGTLANRVASTVSATGMP